MHRAVVHGCRAPCCRVTEVLDDTTTSAPTNRAASLSEAVRVARWPWISVMADCQCNAGGLHPTPDWCRGPSLMTLPSRASS